MELLHKIPNSIERSLFYLHQESQNNFSESFHQMIFPWYAGFISWPNKHIGSVFQYALIADALICAANRGFIVDKSIIAFLINQIISLKSDNIKGWKYFPKLRELPEDIDDLAQIIQAFHRYDKQLIDKYCLNVIDFVFSHCRNNDGSIDTWIINRGDQRLINKRQLKFINTKWGNSIDYEVLANLLYSLYILNHNKYKKYINEGQRVLLGGMNPDGYWPSAWYWDKYYGTYVSCRILAEICKNEKFIKKVCNFLNNNMNFDGGYGEFSSNPLNSAFSILTYYYIDKVIDIDLRKILKTVCFLIDTQSDEGFWMPSPFIKMRANLTKNKKTYFTYESKIITTCFCLKALSKISTCFEK